MSITDFFQGTFLRELHLLGTTFNRTRENPFNITGFRGNILKRRLRYRSTVHRFITHFKHLIHLVHTLLPPKK